MKAAFKNEYIITKKTLYEFQKLILFKNKRIKYIFYCLIVVFFWGLWLLVNSGVKMYVLLMILSPVLFVASMFYKTRKIVNRMYKGAIEIGGKGFAPTMRIDFKDVIVSRNQNSQKSHEYKYDDVFDIDKSKNIILLSIKPNISLILRRDKFVEGSSESFEKFIYSQCKNIEKREEEKKIF